MIRAAVALALSTACLVPVAQSEDAFKMPRTAFSMEHCLNAALAAKAGDVQALEMELNNAVPVYEFTIVAEDESQWEVTCNAMTGRVIALEQEVAEPEEGASAREAAERAAFDAAAKVTEDEARAIALRAHPGEVSEVDRKMTAKAVPVYEVEIEMDGGQEREVEVDAVTGLIVGVEEEIYAIGDD